MAGRTKSYIIARYQMARWRPFKPKGIACLAHTPQTFFLVSLFTPRYVDHWICAVEFPRRPCPWVSSQPIDFTLWWCHVFFLILLEVLQLLHLQGSKTNNRKSHNRPCLQFLMSCQQFYRFSTISAAIPQVATGVDWKQGRVLSLAHEILGCRNDTSIKGRRKRKVIYTDASENVY